MRRSLLHKSNPEPSSRFNSLFSNRTSSRPRDHHRRLTCEPLEERRLLSVTALSFRQGPDISSPIREHIVEGNSIYIRADALGMEGQKIQVKVYEDDGDIGDDEVKTIEITIGNDGFGTTTWTATRQEMDEYIPGNKYYLYYNKGLLPYPFDDPVYSGQRGVGHFWIAPLIDNSVQDRVWENDVVEDNSAPVTLDRIDSDDPITPGIDTWIVIHGLWGKFDNDSLNPEGISKLAKLIVQATNNAQVLTLDWQEGADGIFTGETWIQPTAKWVAELLETYGFSFTVSCD
ncbi:MAG TPA: hypothetical protein VIH42_03935 [Thermoguttaceae bacterium]